MSMTNKESLERFKYIKGLVETDKEIRAAIMVFREKRESKCKDAMLDNKISTELGLKLGSDVWSLLAYYKEYLTKE